MQSVFELLQSNLLLLSTAKTAAHSSTQVEPSTQWQGSQHAKQLLGLLLFSCLAGKKACILCTMLRQIQGCSTLQHRVMQGTQQTVNLQACLPSFPGPSGCECSVLALHSLGKVAPVSKPALGASSNLKSSQGRLQAANSATFSGPSVRHLCKQVHMVRVQPAAPLHVCESGSYGKLRCLPSGSASPTHQVITAWQGSKDF